MHYIKLCTICDSWFISEVFFNYDSSASSSSSSLESTSANSDSVSDNRGVETPVSERSGGTNEELRGDPLHESTETENKIKKWNRRNFKEIYRMNCLDCLQEFRDNLVDESTSDELRGNPMQRSAGTSSSSHEPPMEPRAFVEPGSGNQSVFTHFPKVRSVKYA